MSETTYWTATDPGLSADGEALVAVRPSEELAQAFMRCLYRAFTRKGMVEDFTTFTISTPGGPGYVWVKHRLPCGRASPGHSPPNPIPTEDPPTL